MGGFKEFLTKSNALALAIGVIIGASLGAVVNSLVNDILMPPIGYALGGIDFSDIKTELGSTTAADGTKVVVAIHWGLFINALIVFVIVAFVVYLISKLFIKEEAPAGPTAEETLLTEIRDELTPPARLRSDAGSGAVVGARVAAQDADHRRHAAQAGEGRLGLGRRGVRIELHPEDVLPGPLAAGPRLELAHVQPVLGEHAQGGEQRPGLVLDRHDERRAHRGARVSPARAIVPAAGGRRTRNRVRLPGRSPISSARTSRPNRAAARGDSTAAAPRSARSTIDLPAPAVL